MDYKKEYQLSVKYFSGEKCSVCQVIKPKLQQLMRENFSNVFFEIIDIVHEPQISAQHSVFTLPVVLIFVNNQEVDRFIKFFSLLQIEKRLSKLEKQIM